MIYVPEENSLSRSSCSLICMTIWDHLTALLSTYFCLQELYKEKPLGNCGQIPKKRCSSKGISMIIDPGPNRKTLAQLQRKQVAFLVAENIFHNFSFFLATQKEENKYPPFPQPYAHRTDLQTSLICQDPLDNLS